MPTFTTQQLAEKLQGRLVGPGHVAISGAEFVQRAGQGQLTFIGNEKYARFWGDSQGSAAIVQENIELTDPAGRPLIFVPNADLAMAQVLELLAPPPVRPPEGIHPWAVIDPSATIGRQVTIGPHAYVGAGTQIGDGTILHANVSIMDQCVIGPGCEFFPGVVIRERCRVGAQCIFHPNVSIGADGFGYRPSPDGKGLIKIVHIGTVIIGNAVEIGAGSCIDRGKFSATEIGDGTKIDNLCQIGHNVRIGRCCLLSGQVGLAGSVTVGDGVIMGGKVGVKDHVTIGSGAQLAGYAAVMNDVPAGETWAGYPAKEMGLAARDYIAQRKLPELIKLLKKSKAPK